MSESIIREAQVSDCEHLLALMQESAREQHGTTATKLTSKDLEKDTFGSSPKFTIFVCQTVGDDQIIGFVLFYYTYSTWEGRSVCVEDLFVVPSHRRKGRASALLKKVVQTALETGCSRCNINSQPKNKFLLNQGAVDLTDIEKWLFFRMNEEAMEVCVKNRKILNGVEVRGSTKDDCVGIRKLIQDLADYEKIPDGPKIDASTLEKDGHGDRAFYRCFVAEAGGVLVGYSLFFFTYNVDGHGVYMEDLYVSPEYRGQGVGTALWACVVEASLEIGGRRCDFAVLDWNTPSIEFYKLKGAVDMTQKRSFHFYRMTKDVMENYVKM